METFPYTDPLYRIRLTGAQLRHTVKHVLREEVLLGKERGVFFQLSGGAYCEYDRATRAIVSLKINGKEVLDDVLYTVIMQKFHYMNIEKYLDLTLEEIERNGKAVMAASNSTNVLEEYFVANPLVRLGETPRIIIH